MRGRNFTIAFSSAALRYCCYSSCLLFEHLHFARWCKVERGTFLPVASQSAFGSEILASPAETTHICAGMRASGRRDIFNGDQDAPPVASHRLHKRGCLFAQCLRCPQMLVLTFASGVLPNLPVRPDTECASGIVVTLCSSCADDSHGGKHQAADCANHFKKARISAVFLVGSKVSRAAAETLGEPVPFLTVNGSPMFVLCSFIRRLATNHDLIESVVESEIEARCTTAPLRGGFL